MKSKLCTTFIYVWVIVILLGVITVLNLIPPLSHIVYKHPWGYLIVWIIFISSIPLFVNCYHKKIVH